MKKANKIISYFNKTIYFKFLSIIMLIASFLVITGVKKDLPFSTSLNYAFVNTYFLLLFFLLFVSNILYLSKFLFNNNNFIKRLSDYDTYISECKYITLIINAYCFLILTVISIILVAIRTKSLIFTNTYCYGMSDMLYFSFYLLRLFIIFYFVSIVVFYIYNSKFKKISFIYIGFILLDLLAFSFNYSFRFLVGNVNFNFVYYLSYPNYPNFLSEVYVSAGIISVYYVFEKIIGIFFKNMFRGYNA